MTSTAPLPPAFVAAATDLANEAKRWRDTVNASARELSKERLPEGIDTLVRAQEAVAPIEATYKAFQKTARTPDLSIVDWRNAQEGFFKIYGAVETIKKSVNPAKDFGAANRDVMLGVRFLNSVLGRGFPTPPYRP